MLHIFLHEYNHSSTLSRFTFFVKPATHDQSLSADVGRHFDVILSGVPLLADNVGPCVAGFTITVLVKLATSVV